MNKIYLLPVALLLGCGQTAPATQESPVQKKTATASGAKWPTPLPPVSSTAATKNAAAVQLIIDMSEPRQRE